MLIKLVCLMVQRALTGFGFFGSFRSSLAKETEASELLICLLFREDEYIAESSASHVCALGAHACFGARLSPRQTGWTNHSIPCFVPVFKVLPAKGECKNTYPRC